MLLALLVGLVQVAAGALKLGVLVDYISSPVVTGYITGAGILIGVGQLPNLTATEGGSGNIVAKIVGWARGLDETSGLALAIGLGTAVVILGLRRIDKRIPGAILALGVATAISFGMGGLTTIADLSPEPRGLPPFELPALALTSRELFAVAIAATVLSLVESSAVGRSIAARTGQRLELSAEFVGQGFANIAAGLFGGYPVSGSLSRSALNFGAGAVSRLGGVYAGIAMIGVLLVLGPVVNYTPIASLAGLLLVVAADLVDVPRIRTILSGRPSDIAGFLATLVGTWTLRLDEAIYLGVAISIVMFLRRARLLIIRDMVVDEGGRLREVKPSHAHRYDRCTSIRILHVEGQLFFAAAGELQMALDDALRDTHVRVLIVRIKRTQGLDVTTLSVLEEAGKRMSDQGRHLLLVGMRRPAMELIERTHADESPGRRPPLPHTPGLVCRHARRRRPRARARGVRPLRGLSGLPAGHLHRQPTRAPLSLTDTSRVARGMTSVAHERSPASMYGSPQQICDEPPRREAPCGANRDRQAGLFRTAVLLRRGAIRGGAQDSDLAAWHAGDVPPADARFSDCEAEEVQNPSFQDAGHSWMQTGGGRDCKPRQRSCTASVSASQVSGWTTCARDLIRGTAPCTSSWPARMNSPWRSRSERSYRSCGRGCPRN